MSHNPVGEKETKVKFRSMLHTLQRRGWVDLRTGRGTGLLPWYTLLTLGRIDYLGSRVLRALKNPRLAYKMASEAKVARRRAAKYYTPYTTTTRHPLQGGGMRRKGLGRYLGMILKGDE